jgi:hypothetical protein
MTAKIFSWTELPPDLLVDVSGRLHDLADFIRFHAVCRPWRAAAARRSSATRPTFPPWLLEKRDGSIIHSTVNFPHASSSNASTDRDIVIAEPPTGDDENWVGRADGTAAWLFVASPDPRLIDLVSGDITPLPRFPDDDEIQQTIGSACGTVYSDGTIFLYSSLCTDNPVFTAAILRPGEASWTVMKRILVFPIAGHRCAAYHDGKVLLCAGVDHWCVLTHGGGDHGGFVRWDATDETEYYHDYNYVMESRGELLWACVLVKHSIHAFLNAGDDPSRLSVTVHALEEEGASGKMEWAARDGESLIDRVLVLGHPVSFAMDSAQLDMDGGCAYFTVDRDVFRYSLVDGEAKLVKRMHPGLNGGAPPRVWLQPRPLISPIKKIQ